MNNKQKKIGFRLDASPAVGTGHLMRCLTLANELASEGHQSIFITRALPTSLTSLIIDSGHDLVALPEANSFLPDANSPYAEWLGVGWQEDARQTASIVKQQALDHLIVDHYGIDEKWEGMLKTTFGTRYLPILVFDDLANRKHDCDILVDPSLGRRKTDYQGLVPQYTRLLVGSRYVLLRPEFQQFRQRSLERRAKLQLENILVSMGGTDEKNISGQILGHLLTLGLHANCTITVILGSLAPHAEALGKQAETAPDKINILQGVSNMAELLSATDIAIGAGGNSAWERVYMGVPSYVVMLAENQRKNTIELHETGAAIIVDNISNMFVETLKPDDPHTPTKLGEMSKQALAIETGENTREIINCVTRLCYA